MNPEQRNILKGLYRTATLHIWWEEWPNGSEQPLWRGILVPERFSDAKPDLIPTRVILALLERKAIKRPPHVRQFVLVEATITDIGLAELNIPPAKELRKLQSGTMPKRKQKVKS